MTTLSPPSGEALSATAPPRVTGWAPRGWRQFLPPPEPLRIGDGELAYVKSGRTILLRMVKGG